MVDPRPWTPDLDESSQGPTLPDGMDTAGSEAGLQTDPAQAHEFDDQAPLEPGETIGRFEITRVLGQGGMGVVYAARDPELGRELAVKVLHRSLDGADRRARARLTREARAMAAVSHPNLVTIYDVGQSDGQVFIAMELVPGQTLGQWCRAKPRPWTEILTMYRDAGEGLLAAHDEGLVHRDFKPSNVLLSDKGRVQVLDFGLARAVPDIAGSEPAPSDGRDDDDPPPATAAADPGDSPAPSRAGLSALAVDLTRTGALVGTPAYMSPEQFRGDPTDARTDQFSFCVALWEALFGHRPFEGNSPMALMISVTSGTFRPLPEDTDVPAPIIEALRRGLSIDPERRFDGMRALLDRLHPPALEPETSRPRWWLAGALGLTVLAAAGLWSMQSATRTASPDRAASTHADPPTPVTGSANPGTVHEPTAGLATLDGYITRNKFHSTATRWRTAEQDFARACESAPDHARHCAAVYFCQGQALLEDREPRQAQIRMDTAAELDPAWALPAVGRASALREQERFDEALEAAVTAQGLDPSLWIAVASSAATYTAAGRLDEGIEEYQRALQLAPDHPQLLADLALTYHVSELDSQAVRFAQAALAQDPENMPALMLLAERALEAADGTAALDHADRAVALGPRSAAAWLVRGDALLLLERPDDAMKCFEKVRQLAKLEPEHGAPPRRLAQVEQALERGEVPVPRYDGESQPRERSRSDHPGVEPAHPLERSRPDPSTKDVPRRRRLERSSAAGHAKKPKRGPDE